MFFFSPKYCCPNNEPFARKNFDNFRNWGGGGGAAAPLAAPARTPMAYGLCLEVQQHLVEVAIPVVVETIDDRVEQRKKL